MDLARITVERVARQSYGRLVAILAARSRDIAGAEDALADALLAALRTWPERGVPSNPDAWLLTAARNRVRNAARHRNVHLAAEGELAFLGGPEPSDTSSFPDGRLKLMFICAHPAIDPAIRAPLMLQVVLGLDAARIAGAFLVAPATMGQRLVRAKSKIRDAGLSFEVPDTETMPERLEDVLDAVYAAYGVGWDALQQAPAESRDIADEAIYLGRLLASLLPDEPEALGLLALMLYCEARRGARFAADGAFVPLDRQDPDLWATDMIVGAERLLTLASRSGRLGHYQCEAAIQSVHVQRPIVGRTNHAALVTLYRLLEAHAPSIGAQVGLAAVLVEAGSAAEADRILDAIPPATAEIYQPYWIARARAQIALGRLDAADTSLARAIALTHSEPTRAFLRDLLDRN
jgi:RNA polymerase sigma-70 factor (ECF subfamily)